MPWGLKGPHYGARDRFAANLLNVYLGGGMSSVLFQEIREKNGLAYTVYSNLSPFLDSGLFTVYFATGMNQVPLCLKLVEESVRRLGTKILSEEELEKLKDNLKGTILLSSDSVESRMSSVGRHEMFFGRFISVDEVCREIDAVRPADIRRIARKIVSSGQPSVLALGPKPTAALRAKLSPLSIR